MKEGQNDIYNIKGETVAAVSSFPFLEAPSKKGLEVLYVCDPVDEYAITQLKELDGKTLESCAKTLQNVASILSLAATLNSLS